MYHTHYLLIFMWSISASLTQPLHIGLEYFQQCSFYFTSRNNSRFLDLFLESNQNFQPWVIFTYEQLVQVNRIDYTTSTTKEVCNVDIAFQPITFSDIGISSWNYRSWREESYFIIVKSYVDTSKAELNFYNAWTTLIDTKIVHLIINENNLHMKFHIRSAFGETFVELLGSEKNPEFWEHNWNLKIENSAKKYIEVTYYLPETAVDIFKLCTAPKNSLRDGMSCFGAIP